MTENRGWPRHGIRATLIAPLAAPVIFWLWSAATADDPFKGIDVVFAFGAVMAYAAMLGIGLPALAVLAYFRAINAGVVVALGVVSGLAVAQVLRVGQEGALFPVKFPLWLGAVIGAGCAAAWWRLARPAGGWPEA